MTDKKKLIFVLIPLAVVVLAVFAFFYSQTDPAAAGPNHGYSVQIEYRSHYHCLRLSGSGILDGALALCDEYERIFSRTLEESELYQLNAGTLPQENGAFLSVRLPRGSDLPGTLLQQSIRRSF